MVKLKLNNSYHSRLGSFQAGQIIEVDPLVADALQVDSPGSFSEVKAVASPAKSKQVKRAGKAK